MPFSPDTSPWDRCGPEPVATWFVYQDWIITLLGLLLGGLVVYMHRGNIHRLLTGTENKFSLHKKQ